MDNNDAVEFTPRAYQIDLYEVALKQNTIIYLPTGCGKTFIASMIIKQLSDAVRRPYCEGGKHTVFLVNTVPLVLQQSNYIERITGLSCGGYSGDLGTDFWKDEEWNKELTTNQVLVMTCQILLDALCHGFMYLNRINLLILDECHRAVNDHPMRQIMQLFENCPRDEQPRVLGLTATLLNANVDLHKIESTIRTLEITLHANIATVDSVSKVKNSYANPKERFVSYKPYVFSDVEALICKTLDEMADILECIVLKSSLKDIESSKRFRPKNITNKLVGILNDVKDHFLHTGLYGGNKSILLHMIQLECIKKNHDDADSAYVLEYLISEFTKFRKLLEDEMKDDTEIAKLQNYSSDQVLKLFAVLLEFNRKKSSDQKFCCIIFVRRRFTVKVLYHILKNLSVHHESFKFLHPDYVIGTTNDPYKNSKELLCMSKWNKEVLSRFRNGTSNCLVATDIIDEGIDIPTCTLIIRYNLPMDIRAYIQSKGRARYSASQYTLLLPEGDNKYLKRYEQFKATESYLQKLLLGKTNYRDQPSDSEIKDTLYKYEIEPYVSTNSSGKKCFIREQSAISIINMYCDKLSSSKYTQLTATWRLFKTEENEEPENQCTKYQVSLKLPTVSPLKDTIYGISAPSINIAKRSAAMRMCIKLHEIGELSDNLLPYENGVIPNNLEYLFTNWEEEDDKSKVGMLGTNKNKRAHKLQFPSALYGAYPLPSKPVYLHLLHAKPVYSAPHYDNRYLVFYNLLLDKGGFGILSSKRMPSIPSFPIFMNLGELQVDVKVNYTIKNLSASEINSIKVFHNVIFSRVVPVIKSFMLFDNYNRDNCFLIVPVNEKWEINWETIRQHQQIEHIPPPVPFHFEPNNYHELSLVMPTYRGATEVYVVTQVCEDLTPNSCFPTDNFYSYAHYYKRKHGLTISHLSQPMLEAKMISKRINCIKPRGMHSESKYRKRMETNDDLKEHLIPELCTVIQFPALYWLKATILPSVLHRISQLLIAEDLRHVIANEAKLGLISNDDYWPPLVMKEEEMGDLNDSTMKIPFDECVENFSQSVPVLDGPDVDVLDTDAYHYPWTEDQEPPDLHRKIEDIRLIDIEHHYQFMTGRCDPESNVMKTKKTKFMKASLVPIRPLKILSVKNTEGPSPVHIMHALTSKHAQDAFDLERLETLGDACLKFLTTLFLYAKFPNNSEGHLTTLKCKIIGNRNLYYCGKKKCIPGRIKVEEFVPFSNFIAPAYAVFRQLQPILLDAEVSPNVLYEIQVPEKEQFSGCISEVTKNTIESKVANWKSAETQTGMEHYLGMQTVSDKTVADCVEALIGVYLTSMGIEAAIDLLKWFEILPKEAVDTDILLFAVSENVGSEESVNHFMPWAGDIQERLGYKFQNPSLLLQAFTHPSYTANNITACYERLEFLGDAIIDFLITCYIYEYCGNFNPGTLTDLRSALVNNITFACLSVRYGLHTALLSYAPQLNDAIDRFVKFQEQRNHIVNDELLWILLEEDECKLVESVDVPKALGDIFESTIGAIYLDCGKNLKTVWGILYCLMHKEIDEFSQNIPKQPIRVLYETQGARPQFSKAVHVDGTDSVMVPLQVIIAGKVKVLHGFGKNQKEAKCAAAKLALKYLLRKN